jgi:hypothetical protein
MNNPIELILQIIDDRIENSKQDLKEHTDQNIECICFGFNYDLGALDELIYLKDEIKEKLNL